MTYMLRKDSRKSEEHLINLIKRRNVDTPNFALLIGAGASATSGVKLAKEMIDEWRLQLYKQSRSKKTLEAWLADQDWYKDPEEYSILFETIYDQAAQRRNYIEDCIKDATPSWGYIYLANIFSQNYFNIVFTPNFDDLLNEACFLYSTCRPIVCAHDSTVNSIRVTLKRQKIVKLHGDFLYDNIKNTRSETETLEKNMRDKFAQFAREYGLVLIGYGGNDKSIMDTLEILLNTEGCFPHGIYWCLRKNSEKNRQLSRFLERPRVYEVEIESFDDFMAKLHDGLGLALPDAVQNPYKATTDRLNNFIGSKGEKTDNKIINRDIESLAKQVNKLKDILCQTTSPQEALVPFLFLGDSALNNGDATTAINYLKEAINQDSRESRAYLLLGKAYALESEFGEARKIIDQFQKSFPLTSNNASSIAEIYRFFDSEEALKYYDLRAKLSKNDTEKSYALTAKSNELLKLKRYAEGLSEEEESLRIGPKTPAAIMNKAIALKKLGHIPESEALLKEALQMTKDSFHNACAYAGLNDKENMIASLKKSLTERYVDTILWARSDPDFEDYREDPEFKKILTMKHKNTGN